MNQRTWALLATMSDAIGRPLFSPSPIQGQPGFMLNGSPVIIASQMPDCLPGNTPILYGNLRQLYTLVNRSATTMTPDPYTAQFCHLFKFEARVGAGITCANAARLLRVN
jgi:HK97 family phage major capsid protein